MEDNIFKAIVHLNEKVSDLEEKDKGFEKDILQIKQQIGMLQKRSDVVFKEEWMDGQDVMLALHISPRTLRTLRASGILIPSRIGKKYYYKTQDIKSLLEKNYIRNHLKRK